MAARCSISPISRNLSPFAKWIFFALTLLLCSISYGQTTISSITVSARTGVNTDDTGVIAPSDAGNDIVSGGSYNIQFGRGNNDEVSSYTVNGRTYDNFLTPDTLAIRRTDGSRFINIWYTLITDPLSGSVFTLDVDPDEVTDADAIYQLRSLNAGYDNILVNVDDEANQSIQAQTERIDIIWKTGIVTCEPDSAIFPVIERGGNDEVKVAAITSLDANGDPSGYTDLVLIQDSDWPGMASSGQEYDNFLIFRRQTVGQDPLPLINIGTYFGSQTSQVVQGVAVSFTDLGVAANEVVYGYSIFASDVDASTHTLTDISTFPTDTKASDSGLDLIAGVTAAVSADNCLTPANGPGGYKSALSTWLKANETDDITGNTNGANVTDWQDQWVGDHDFVTSTGNPTYNTEAINFNQSVDFESGSNTLTTPSNTDFDNATSYTRKGINIVFRTSSSDVTTRQVIYEQGGNDKGINFYIRSGSLYVSAWNQSSDGAGSPWNTGTIATVSDTVSTNREYIVTLEFDGNASVGSGSVTVYKNGRSLGTLSNAPGLLFQDSSGIELGGSDGSTQYDDGTNSSTNSFFGEIPEFIYCNEPTGFTTDQRNRTESYLAVKYGITLNQSTPNNYFNSNSNVIFDATTAAASGGFLEYNSDITGIGRDDQSEFEQIKSRTENKDPVVTIERTGSFPEDDTWLIWGNDNASRGDSDANSTPALIDTRLTRVWRASETNESGSLTISFDVSELSLTGTPVESDYSLLIANSSSGGSFSGATVITGGSLAGSILTFTGVDLEDGEYFTLGTSFISCAPGNVTTNLALWLKADLGTNTIINGQDITTWSDVSGAGNNATATAAPVYNTNKFNFNPSIDFTTANGDYMQISDNTNLNPDQQALFVVGAFSNSANDFAPFLVKSNDFNIADGWGLIRSGVGDEEIIYSKDGNFNAFNNMTYDVPSINVAYTDGSNYNHSLELGTVSSGAKTTLATSTNSIYIGADSGSDGSTPGSFLDGPITEIIMYTDDLTATERQRIVSYLAIKYGKTIDQSSAQNYLAADGGTIWNGTTNSSYNDDIAGIGRDDNSCLEQKQSKSVNTDAIVTIGNVDIAATNQANSNSFSADDSFLVWGNDGAAREQGSAITSTDVEPSTNNDDDTPLGISERMLREWRVQETGTVGNTEISFDLTGLGYTLVSSNFNLLIDPDGDFDDATIVSGGTLNGSILTFNNVDFTDGDYFTLGTRTSITCGPGGVTDALALWLKADEGTNTTTDNGDVTSWSDQSGVGRNAATSSLGGITPVDPTYQTQEINFNPAIDFVPTGSSNTTYLETSNGNNVNQDMSMIAVFKSGQASTDTTNFQAVPALIGSGVSGSWGDYGFGMLNGRLVYSEGDSTVLDARSGTGTLFNDLEPHIGVATRDNVGGASSILLYADGASVANGESSTVDLSNPVSFGIGNHDSGNEAGQFNGKIAEAIVFSDILTSTERQQIESYLALKYGITKATTDNYLASDGATAFWDFSENGTYNNDIAGLGIDNGSCLLQTKSKSENDDAIVTMEIGGLSTDNSWMVWANDDAALEDPTNREYDRTQVRSRLNREWRVQENGTVGSVTLTFDLDNVTGPTGVGTNSLSQLRLMVDADGDFTTGTSYTDPTSFDAGSNTVTFTVNFTDGQFFTLGSYEVAALPISLLSFEAQLKENSKVELKWTTASETNNSFFTLERSKNGKDFEVLGRLDGAGNSVAILHYSFVDHYPLEGFNFYRLKQTDFSGDYSYSEVRTVDVQLPVHLIFSLYPNPIKQGETLRLSYASDKNQKVILGLINTRGRVYFRKEIQLIHGEDQIEISTAGLEKGLSLIRIVDEEGIIRVHKVIIH